MLLSHTLRISYHSHFVILVQKWKSCFVGTIRDGKHGGNTKETKVWLKYSRVKMKQLEDSQFDVRGRDGKRDKTALQ